MLDTQISLSHSIQVLAYLLEHSSQPMVAGYPDGRILEGNQAFCDLVGYTKEELNRISWITDLTPPEWRQHEAELMPELVRTGKPLRYEKEYIRKDGSRVPIELLAHHTPVANVKTLFYYAFITDITERKRAEAELNTYRTHLEELVEQQAVEMTDILERITDGFFALDKNLNFTYLNKATEAFLLRPREELLGKSWLDTVYDEEAYKYYCKALSDRQKHVHFVIPAKTTAKWAEIDVYPAANGISVFLRDITEKKRMEQELSRFDMLSVIGQMSAGISHEVRNPMTTVRGFLQMLAQKDDCAKYKTYFDLMISELDRANGIITQFLSLTREKPIDDTYFEEKNLNDIIKKLSPLLQADTLETGNNLLCELNPVPDNLLNEKEICQLLLNLVRNANEAMPSGGSITIRTHQQDNQTVLSVKDEGTGIPQNILAKLGTPFLTTKDKGTGLGIATCHGIAQRHNGKLEVVETSEQGTTFAVTFPSIKRG